MNNSLLKILLLGSVGYLIYKYYYLPSREIKNENSTLETFNEDGRSIFYGDTKDDFVRGFPFPKKITDIKHNSIYIITKPNESIFDLPPRAMVSVYLNTETNRIIYPKNTSEKGEEYIANYDKVKDKMVMAKDYTKNEING